MQVKSNKANIFKKIDEVVKVVNESKEKELKDREKIIEEVVSHLLVIANFTKKLAITIKKLNKPSALKRAQN